LNQSFIAHPANRVEAAFYSVKSAVLVLGRSATGRADMINSKRALKDIAGLRKQIDAMEVICRADLATERAAATAKRAADRKHVRQMTSYVAKHPDQLDRAILLGAINPDYNPGYAADGLVAMVKAAQPVVVTMDRKPFLHGLFRKAA
jgi:hypothetical protein